MKILKTILSFLLLSNILLAPVVLASEPLGSADSKSTASEPLGSADSKSTALERLKNIVEKEDASTFDEMTDANTFTEFIGLIISVILSLLGVIFMGLMLWAGYTWMTAGGNEEKVSQAGHAIKVAIIGLLIVVGSFAIWRFVFERIIKQS
jgi:hypothetical protein